MSRRDETALIGEALAGLPSPVTLRYYVPDVDSAVVRGERALLERVAAASPMVRLDVRPGRWDAASERAVGIARTPCLALEADGDTGIRFYGVPDGYELETFLGILAAAASRRSGLTADTEARLRAIPTGVHLEVLASPT